MAKQSLLVPSGLYNVKYGDYGNFKIFGVKDKLPIWKELMSKPNNNLILNFDDKKDKRRKDTKIENSCDFYMGSFAYETYPLCDFTFNQERTSSTIFRLQLQNNSFPSNKTPVSDDNTFTFNGLFEKAYISSGGYRNYVLNGFSKEESENALEKSTSLEAYDSLVKTIKVKNQDHLTVRQMQTSKLESLTFENCPNLYFSFNNFRCQELKTINCKTCKNIQFNFGDYMFDTLKINKERYSSSKPADSFIRDYDNFTKENLNADCEIILSPDSKILVYDLLPPSEEAQFSNPVWPAKDIFPDQANKSEIKVKVIDILMGCYKMKKQWFDNQQTELLNTVINKAKQPKTVEKSKER